MTIMQQPIAAEGYNLPARDKELKKAGLDRPSPHRRLMTELSRCSLNSGTTKGRVLKSYRCATKCGRFRLDRGTAKCRVFGPDCSTTKRRVLSSHGCAAKCGFLRLDRGAAERCVFGLNSS